MTSGARTAAFAALVAVLLLCGAVAGETCIGNSTYAGWNDDNVLSQLCADATQAVWSQGNATAGVHYYRTAVELPQTANAAEAVLTLTATDASGTEHQATATAEELIVTVCFTTNVTLSSVRVSASEEYVASHYLRYGFFFDELANASCPGAPPNQIYNYLSSAQDGPDDEDCTCNDHGTCSGLENYCACEEGWFGLQCQLYCMPEETCNGLGRCHRPDARCQCNDCYFGEACEYVDPECLVLLPTPTPTPTLECDCPDCDSTEPMSWRSLVFFIVCIGIVVILTAICLIYVVLKKIRRITEKKEYIPASILDDEEIEW